MDKKVNTPYNKKAAVLHVNARCYIELLNDWMAL